MEILLNQKPFMILYIAPVKAVMFVDGDRCYVRFGAEDLKNIVIMMDFEDE